MKKENGVIIGAIGQSLKDAEDIALRTKGSLQNLEVQFETHIESCMGVEVKVTDRVFWVDNAIPKLQSSNQKDNQIG